MSDLMHIPQSLVLEFFVTFSRFEYALKRAGYLKKKSNASADWVRFAEDVQALPDDNKAVILDSAPYLQGRPPKKQIAVNGALQWQIRPMGASPIQSLIESVKTVRNNLFHGGKFPEELISEPARDEQLLRDCIRVLQVVREQPVNPCPEVARHFNENPG